jgi:hypothetical protein
VTIVRDPGEIESTSARTSASSASSASSAGS